MRGFFNIWIFEVHENYFNFDAVYKKWKKNIKNSREQYKVCEEEENEKREREQYEKLKKKFEKVDESPRDSELKQKLAKLIELIREFGEDSTKVDEFVRQYSDDDEFLKLAAIICFLHEKEKQLE